jgi:hypothetical protein
MTSEHEILHVIEDNWWLEAIEDYPSWKVDLIQIMGL